MYANKYLTLTIVQECSQTGVQKINKAASLDTKMFLEKEQLLVSFTPKKANSF